MIAKIKAFMGSLLDLHSSLSQILKEEILLKVLFLDPSFQKVFNDCIKVLPIYV